jgi:hypothetical protein
MLWLHFCNLGYDSYSCTWEKFSCFMGVSASDRRMHDVTWTAFWQRPFCHFAPSILGAFAKFRKANIKFILSVYPSAWNNFAPTGRIFMKLEHFLKSIENFRVLLKFDANNEHFTYDLCVFVIVSRPALLRNIDVSEKLCRENQNSHFMFNKHFPKIVPLEI